jgi:hypothetical protein
MTVTTIHSTHTDVTLQLAVDPSLSSAISGHKRHKGHKSHKCGLVGLVDGADSVVHGIHDVHDTHDYNFVLSSRSRQLPTVTVPSSSFVAWRFL